MLKTGKIDPATYIQKLTQAKVDQGDIAKVEIYRIGAGRLQYQQAVLQARTSYDGSVRDILNLLGAREQDVQSSIAQTTDGTCKACHMSLPPQLFHRLRREPTLEQCPSCNRIIYFAPPEPAVAPSHERG